MASTTRTQLTGHSTDMYAWVWWDCATGKDAPAEAVPVARLPSQFPGGARTRRALWSNKSTTTPDGLPISLALRRGRRRNQLAPFRLQCSDAMAPGARDTTHGVRPAGGQPSCDADATRQRGREPGQYRDADVHAPAAYGRTAKRSCGFVILAYCQVWTGTVAIDVRVRPTPGWWW